MAATFDKSKQDFRFAGAANDGWSKEDEATATCFCGTVQLVFPTQGPGLVDSFVCHCADDHKISATMFASNFTVLDKYLTHVRGRDNLKTYSQSKTIASGNNMTNYFCSTCGSLMYRVSTGLPGQSILRIGSIDDFNLMETKLRPRREQVTEGRMSWLHEIDHVKHSEGNGVYSQEKF